MNQFFSIFRTYLPDLSEGSPEPVRNGLSKVTSDENLKSKKQKMFKKGNTWLFHSMKTIMYEVRSTNLEL